MKRESKKSAAGGVSSKVSGVPVELEALLAPLKAVQELLARFGNRGIIIGGVAVSLLGRPRLTADVDAMLLFSVSELPSLLQRAGEVGLEPRISDALEFARRHRVLLLCHRDSGINVDLSLGLLPFEQEAVERSLIYKIGSLELRLPTPEDLIIFKAVAHRPVDLEDIKAIVEAHPDLDKKRIQEWVQAFAQVLEMPEIWEDVARILMEGA